MSKYIKAYKNLFDRPLVADKSLLLKFLTFTNVFFVSSCILVCVSCIPIVMQRHTTRLNFHYFYFNLFIVYSFIYLLPETNKTPKTVKSYYNFGKKWSFG